MASRLAKMTRPVRNLLLAAGLVVVGAAGGFAVGISRGARPSARWAAATESRYAHDMFCFASAEQAQRVLQNYVQQLETRREDGFLWKREYSAALASLASTKEKAGQKVDWAPAIRACERSEGRVCTLETLRRELTVTCSIRPTKRRPN